MSDQIQGSEGPSSCGFQYDSASGELGGPEGVARLAPQPGALLQLLIEKSDQVVTRDEIREHLWPGGKVEFEQGIAFAIREVRKAMQAAGIAPDPIETIPRRGFRLRAAATPAGSTTVLPLLAGSRS